MNWNEQAVYCAFASDTTDLRCSHKERTRENCSMLYCPGFCARECNNCEHNDLRNNEGACANCENNCMWEPGPNIYDKGDRSL